MDKKKTLADLYLKDGVDVDKIVYDFVKWLQNNGKTSRIEIERITQLITEYLNSNIKPTLTEDEKVILKHINSKEIDRIGKDKCGDLILLCKDGGYYMIPKCFNYVDLFQFIQPRRRI